MESIVIGITSGPGTGKSILAAELFAGFKRLGISCELAREYIKDKFYEGAQKTIENQIYIFGKQQHILHRLAGEVQIIITDAPLINSAIYEKSGCEFFRGLVLKEFHKYNNLLFLLNRNSDVAYEFYGRHQDENGARRVDRQVKQFLVKNNVEFHNIYRIDKESQKIIIEKALEKING